MQIKLICIFLLGNYDHMELDIWVLLHSPKKCSQLTTGSNVEKVAINWAISICSYLKSPTYDIQWSTWIKRSKVCCLINTEPLELLCLQPSGAIASESVHYSTSKNPTSFHRLITRNLWNFIEDFK